MRRKTVNKRIFHERIFIFKESENPRIKKLITGIDLGNIKPSQLLQKLKSGNGCVTN